MIEIVTTKKIAAPAEDIWRVLMDFPSYTHWNPFVRKISGVAEEGRVIAITLQGADGKLMKFRPKVLQADPSKAFVWRGHLFFPGIFDGKHQFLFESLGPNETLFTHKETFRGLLVPFLRKMLSDTKKSFETMNDALEAEVEKRALRE